MIYGHFTGRLPKPADWGRAAHRYSFVRPKSPGAPPGEVITPGARVSTSPGDLPSAPALSPQNRRAIVGPSLGTNFTIGARVLYEYGHIGILAIIALIFPLGALVTSWAFRFADPARAAMATPSRTTSMNAACAPRARVSSSSTSASITLRCYSCSSTSSWCSSSRGRSCSTRLASRATSKGCFHRASFASASSTRWRKRALEWRL